MRGCSLAPGPFADRDGPGVVEGPVVSFAAESRKVLDTSLSLGLRHTAFRHCVWKYCPIGYQATHSFLHATVGNFTRDPSLLPAALEMLTASYNAWQTELRAYGLMRSHAKRLGQRTPHPSALNPNRRLRWYGAPREAALHAVWFWFAKGDSPDVDVQALAVALLERGRFTEEQREVFERVRAEPGASWRVVRQMEVVVGA